MDADIEVDEDRNGPAVVHIHPEPVPEAVNEAWRAALEDASIDSSEAALIWRVGRPRPTGQQAASWRPGSIIDPEFDDDHEFIHMLDWANSDKIRSLRRVMIWIERTPEGVAGLLRHELEHTIQLAADIELDHLHQRAFEELGKRSASAKSYNLIPMEIDANRAAARFLRRRYGTDRLEELVVAGDKDVACFRPTAEPESLDTLADRMRAFILKVMKDDDFLADLEMVSPPE